MDTTMTLEERTRLRILLLLRALDALVFSNSGPSPDRVATSTAAWLVGYLAEGIDLPREGQDDPRAALEAVKDEARALPLEHRCLHATPDNLDHWLGRMAWHLELLLRHHDGAAELDSAAHRSVAGEMARACLADYRWMRAGVPAGAVA